MSKRQNMNTNDYLCITSVIYATLIFKEIKKLQKQAKNHYHCKSDEEQAKKYYEDNKERLQNKNKYREVSNEKTV